MRKTRSALPRSRPGPTCQADMSCFAQGVTRFCRLEFANDLLQALANARNLAQSPDTAQLVQRLEELGEKTCEEKSTDDVFGPRCVAISQRTTAARLTKALYPQCRSRPASHRCHRLGSLALVDSAEHVSGPHRAHPQRV